MYIYIGFVLLQMSKKLIVIIPPMTLFLKTNKRQ